MQEGRADGRQESDYEALLPLLAVPSSRPPCIEICSRKLYTALHWTPRSGCNSSSRLQLSARPAAGGMLLLFLLHIPLALSWAT